MVSEIEDSIDENRSAVINSRVEKAKAIIDQRFKEKDFSLKEICNQLYLSVSQFSLIFKEGTGKTFIDFLTERRLDEARKLLKTTDKKAYEIAEECGYSDPRYFSILFKKHTGMTALEYRRSFES